MPCNENTLLLYIASLSGRGVEAATIKVYLAAIKSMHVLSGLAPPPTCSLKINLAIKAVFEAGKPPKPKAPLTFARLVELWPVMYNSKNFILFSAVISFGFFSGMRASEYSFDSNVPGSEPNKLGQLSIDSKAGLLSYKVSRSKTQPHGFSVELGCSGHSICTYCCVRAYIQLRAASETLHRDSPLFVLSSGKPVSKQDISNYIKSIVAQLGWDPSIYASHSLRSGVASTAGSLNFNQWEIKDIGGWKSNAFVRYVRPSDKSVMSRASRLAQLP